MYQIKLIENASESIIQIAIEMDHAAFPLSDWITDEEADLIYLNKKDCLIWLVHENEPIGLVTIFALNKSVPMEAIKKGKPIYKILNRDILSDGNTDVLYLHCILLLPQYQGKGLTRNLYEGLKRWLEAKGGDFSVLYADAVSAEGKRCLERLQFKEIYSFGSEGALYSAEKKSVMDAI